MNVRDIEQELDEAGLNLRGAFHPIVGDGVPNLPTDALARTVVLAGNAGPHMWPRFALEHAQSGTTLDAWSEMTLIDLAKRLGACAVFPFKRPYLAFQRWAMRAEACYPSPLGLLIHPDYGLWHGYRGALLFAEEFELRPPDRRGSPCDVCEQRPCLSACPAGAFAITGYDVSACARHLGTVPESACMEIGCLARHACPVGRSYHYTPDQARFHMQAFRRNHLPSSATNLRETRAS